MKNKYSYTKTMQSFNEKYLFIINQNNLKKRRKFKIHTTVKIFIVGHGLLPNKHLPRLSKNVNICGAQTDANNIHTQRSRYGV